MRLECKISQIYISKLIQSGADVYLTKPFEKEELFIRLKNLIELRQKLLEKYRNINISLIPEQEVSEDVDLQFLQQMESVIIENLSNEHFKVTPDLCRAMQMSRSQLYRKVKALKGVTPNEHLRTLRLRRAKELLTHSDFTIGEIAMRVGIGDQSYFTKLYVTEYGVRPSEEKK